VRIGGVVCVCVHRAVSVCRQRKSSNACEQEDSEGEQEHDFI